MFDFATTARLAGQFWTVHYTTMQSVSFFAHIHAHQIATQLSIACIHNQNPLSDQSCLQLILEKIAPAAAGMLFLVGSGCYIAKEVGWMVSKGTGSANIL